MASRGVGPFESMHARVGAEFSTINQMRGSSGAGSAAEKKIENSRELRPDREKNQKRELLRTGFSR